MHAIFPLLRAVFLWPALHVHTATLTFFLSRWIRNFNILVVRGLRLTFYYTGVYPRYVSDFTSQNSYWRIELAIYFVHCVVFVFWCGDYCLHCTRFGFTSNMFCIHICNRKWQLLYMHNFAGFNVHQIRQEKLFSTSQQAYRNTIILLICDWLAVVSI